MTTFAFPSGHNPQRGRQEDGMTLRDYFAAKIMQSLVDKMNVYADTWNAFEEANIAYQIADAMIKVRDEL